MKKNKKRVVTGFSVLLLVFFAVAVFMYFTVRVVQVSGVSMLPTLKNGQRVLVTKAYWLVGNIRKNDIVVLKDEEGGPGAYIIKRVKYMPRTAVDFTDVPDSYDFKSGPFMVPEGDIYVMGDNRPQSEDSRKFGPVPLTDVLGKVVVWP